MPRDALKGVRVLDVTHWLAGPAVTSIVAQMGAEVVKVESIQHFDGGRAMVGTGERLYEKAPTYNHFNRNKHGITLNLQDPRGVAVFKELIRISDALVDNFPARVMERFGLGWETIRELNPTLVWLSMSAFGQTGPWREYVSYATPMGQMSGLFDLTGYPDEMPATFSPAGLDPITGILAAGCLMMCLVRRQRTGRGMRMDYAQLEAATSLAGDAVAEYTMNGRVPTRMGDQHRFAIPHGAFPCQGDDAWVAICVCTDAEFQGLCKAMEQPGLADDSRFATYLARRRHRAELDELVRSWTAQHEKYEAARLLQAQGVAAGPVISNKELLDDSHLLEREAFEEVERAYVGRPRYQVTPIRLSKLPRTVSRPASTLGGDNALVLGELLALPKSTLAELEAAQVIGTEPLTTSV